MDINITYTRILAPIEQKALAFGVEAKALQAKDVEDFIQKFITGSAEAEIAARVRTWAEQHSEALCDELLANNTDIIALAEKTLAAHRKALADTLA